MLQRRRFAVRSLLALAGLGATTAVIAAVAPGSADAAVCGAYYKAGGGAWSTQANWFSDAGHTTALGFVPGTSGHTAISPCWATGDTVTSDGTWEVTSIPSSGVLGTTTGTLTIDSASTVAGLTGTGGTISTAGTLSVGGNIGLSGAYLAGTGAVTQTAGTVTLNAGTQLYALDFNAFSSITVNGTVYVSGTSGANTPMQITAKDLVLGDGAYLYNYQYGGAQITLSHALSRTATGTNIAYVTEPVTFTGTGAGTGIVVTNGTLSLNPANTGSIAGDTSGHNPAVTVSGANSQVNLNGGSISLGAVDGTGAGTLLLNGANPVTLTSLSSNVEFNTTSGSLVASGAFTPDSYTQSGGTVELQSATSSLPGFTSTSGTLQLDATIPVTGSTTLSGGYITGAGTFNQTAGTLTLNNSSQLYRATIKAFSTITVNGTVYVSGASGSNTPAQIFAKDLVLGDGANLYNYQYGGAQITLSRALSRTASGTNIAYVSEPVTFTGSGAGTGIVVTNGTLSLSPANSGSIAGDTSGHNPAVTVSGATSQLNLNGGGISLGAVDGSGAGTLLLNGANPVTLTSLSSNVEFNVSSGSLVASGAFTPDSYTQSGGTVELQSATSSLPGFTSTSGTLQLDATIPVTGTTTLSGGYITGVGTFNQTAGTLTLNGGSQLYRATIKAFSTITVNGTVYVNGASGSNTPEQIFAKDLVLGDGANLYNYQYGGAQITLSHALSRTASGTNIAYVSQPVTFTGSGAGTGIVVTNGTLSISVPATGTGTLAGDVTGDNPAVTLSGATAQLNLNGGNMSLGAVDGTGGGTLVLNGANPVTLTSVSSNVGVAASGGQLTASGAFTPASFSQTGATVELQSATSSLPGFTSTGGTLQLDATIPVTGTTTISGGYITGAGTFNQTAGTLTLNSGSQLYRATVKAFSSTTINGTVYLNGTSGSNAPMSLTTGDLILGPSTYVYNYQYGGGIVTVSGAVTSTGTSPTVSTELDLTSTGSLHTAGTFNLGTFKTAGTVTVDATGTLNVSSATQTAGTTTDDGTIIVSGSGATYAGTNTWEVQGGTFKGTGALQGPLLNNGGSIAPGDSPGTLTVSAFTQQAGTFAVEVAGASSGQYDSIVIKGYNAPTIGGTIAVTDLGGYVPPAGTTLPIVTCDSATSTACQSTPNPTVTATTSDDLTGSAHYKASTASKLVQLSVAGPPSAPAPASSSNVTFTGATVSWTTPTSLNSSTITGYTITCAPSCGTPPQAGPTATSQALTGLSPSTAYTVSIVANSSKGDSPAATTTFTTPTPATVPGAPSGVSAKAGDATATVSFTPPASDGGAPISTYTVTVSGGGSTKTVSGAGTPIVVTGLTNGTTYTVTVHATNSVGNSPESGQATVTPLAPPGAVTATGTSPSPGALLVSFTPLTGGNPVTSYTVTCTQQGGASKGTATGPSSPLKVTGLLNNTDYTCSVHATGAAGDGPEGNAVAGRPGKLPTVTVKITVNGKAVKAVKVGTKLKITGTATVGDKPAVKRTVMLTFTQTGKKTAVTLAKAVTNAKGAFTFTTTFKKAGGYQVRLPLGPATAFNKSVVIKRAV